MGECSKVSCCLAIFIAFSVGLLVTTIYFGVQAHSDVSQRLGECQGQIKLLEEQKKKLEVEADGEKQKVTALESDLLHTQKLLQEAQKQWDSCRRRASALQNSTAALKARVLQLGGSFDDLEVEDPGEQEIHPMLTSGTWGSKAQLWSPGVASYLLLLTLSLAGILM